MKCSILQGHMFECLDCKLTRFNLLTGLSLIYLVINIILFLSHVLPTDNKNIP